MFSKFGPALDRLGRRRRTIPLEIWGPEGTRDMMDALQRAFAFDIHMRRDVDEKLAADGIRVISHDTKEGVVLDVLGVKVTAFLVDHGLLAPALGYRVDYRGHSVALSGDTRVSENLIRFAQGVDVLVHEVADAQTNPEAARRHTTPEQAGEIFTRVKPRLAVYSHAPNTENVVTQTRKRIPARFRELKTCCRSRSATESNFATSRGEPSAV